jgi:glycosyltransferase involved in cell wall biosynthesis
MNLLVISNNPHRASFKQRIEIYLAMLRDNGIHCEVAPLPAGSLARSRLFARAQNFDGVVLHKKGLNFLDAFCLHKHSRTIIYDFDDAVMYSAKMPGRDSFSRLRRFRRSVRAADLIIAGNSYLAAQAKRFSPHVEIIPTGLNVHDYQARTDVESDGKIRLVWIGSRTTLRYLAEIVPALSEIGSQFSNVVLRIICDDFLDVPNLRVEKRQWFSDKQAADLAACDIGLAPLPDNRFTRGKCGFKVLQYGACGLPVVASPVGVNAEYVVDGVTGFHARSIPEWIDTISRLVTNRQLRMQMGREGRVKVERFDVKIIGEQLLGLLKRHLNSAGAESCKG